MAGYTDEGEKLEGKETGYKKLYERPLSEAEAYLRAVGGL